MKDLVTKTEKIRGFLSGEGISVRQAERMLGVSNGALRINAKGHFTQGMVEKFEKMFFEDGVESPESLEQEDNAEIVDKNGVSENTGVRPKTDKVVYTERRYGNFRPEFKDGIARFRDPDTGLWKRLLHWASITVKGERRIKESYMPSTGEYFTDDIGDYYIANCNIKVYTFDKNG